MNNLAVRTISGVAFILVMMAGLLLSPIAYFCLALCVLECTMSEFYRMSIGDDLLVTKCLAYVTGITLLATFYMVNAFGMPVKTGLVTLFPLALTFASSLFSKDREKIADKMAYILTGILYTALPVALSTFLVFKDGEFSGMLIIIFFVLIWTSDVGAYCLGTAFGQKATSRKLCPHISPKKSWVGFWGGVATTVIVAVALRLAGVIDFPMVHCVALGIILSVFGVVGDLFESQWKRHFGVKDSGNIIPGHGGLLDRFDSSLVAMPLGAIYLSLFNLI